MLLSLYPRPLTHPDRAGIVLSKWRALQGSRSLHPRSRLFVMSPAPASVADEARDQQLVEKVACPHCWHAFPPEELRFIATSAALAFDHRLGDGKMRRFLPSEFTFTGDAVDPAGGTCTETACPNCHLKVPKLLTLRDTFTVSIFGSPSSGKSYLLAAMMRMLGDRLGDYRLSIDDVDAESNAIIHDYERSLFNQPTPESPVKLLKTDLVGDWYQDVFFDGVRKTLPKPFLYRLDPLRSHPALSRARAKAQVICIYDNAGESFEPGSEQEGSPVTRHMAKARGLLFVFDPTQETSFRNACRERSSDPQWADQRMSRQQTLFSEAMGRVLRFRGLQPTDRVDTPLVVALPKYDAWSFLLGDEPLPEPWRDVPLKGGAGSIRVFDRPAVRRVSAACREVLAKHAAPMLTRIEERCDPSRVLFVPVSATGCGPAGKDEEGKYYHRFGDIAPIWAEVPLLTLLNGAIPELVPSVSG